MRLAGRSKSHAPADSRFTGCLPKERRLCITWSKSLWSTLAWGFGTGKAFQKLGVSNVSAPGSYWSDVNLNAAVNLGQYRSPTDPEEPILLHLSRAPNKPGLPAREQHKIGRYELLTTSFETFERSIRDQLARTLGSGGFDPARDIAAITVNRWPHGYAYEYNSLFDSFWLEGGEAPCEVARRPFGRIAIANSDAGAYAYTDEAINQAWRAVGEITKT